MILKQEYNNLLSRKIYYHDTAGNCFSLVTDAFAVFMIIYDLARTNLAILLAFNSKMSCFCFFVFFPKLLCKIHSVCALVMSGLQQPLFISQTCSLLMRFTVSGGRQCLQRAAAAVRAVGHGDQSPGLHRRRPETCEAVHSQQEPGGDAAGFLGCGYVENQLVNTA